MNEKRLKNFLFDVTMGSHDGAEVCELAIYLFGKLSTIIDKKNDGFT